MRKPAVFLIFLFAISARVLAGEESVSIEDLGGRLASEDLQVRRQAAWQLWQRRADAAPVAAALAAALRDQDGYVRETSAQAVRYLLIDSPAAVPELVRGLADERVEVRRLASEMLAFCDGHVVAARDPLMLALARDEDAQVRTNAANSLRLLPRASAAPAVPVLVTAAADPVASVRMQAVLALGWLGNAEALEVSVGLLQDEDPLVREAALRSLQGMADLPDELAVKTAALLKDEDEGARRRAAFVLGKFRGRPAVAVPALLQAIVDEAHFVRVAAAVSLGQFGGEDVRIPAALGKALEEEEYWLSQAALQSLAKTGPAAASQLPAVARVLRTSEDVRLRYSAADTIDKILGEGIADAVAALEAETNRDPDGGTIRAAAALLRIRVRDPDSLALLLDALADDRLGPAAARLLGDLDRAAQAAIPRLLSLSKEGGPAGLRADSVLIRVAVLEAEEAQLRLRGILKTADPDRRLQAINAIVSLGPAAAVAVDDLAALLDDDDGRIRLAAAMALGSIGPDARGALPALRRMLAEAPPGSAAAWAEFAIREISKGAGD